MSITLSFAGLFMAASGGNRSAASALARDAAAPKRRQHGPELESLDVEGERMVRAARRRDRRSGLLVLKLSDLPELELVFGREAADEVVDDLMTELAELAGRTGLAVRTAPDTFALLIPGLEGTEVHRALQARLGKACCIEFELDEEEVLAVPEIMARTIGETQTVRAAYETMCAEIETEHRLEESRRDYLRREREAHTVPMELPLARPHMPQLSDQPAFGFYPTLPATIPVPMGLR